MPTKICSRRHSKFYYFFFFSEKTSPDISCELAAKQMIHMKCQDLFSLNIKKKKKKMNKTLSSAAVVIGALRANCCLCNVCFPWIGPILLLIFNKAS